MNNIVLRMKQEMKIRFFRKLKRDSQINNYQELKEEHTAKKVLS